MLYYDPMYITQKGGASGPPNWIYFTYVITSLIVICEISEAKSLGGRLGYLCTRH